MQHIRFTRSGNRLRRETRDVLDELNVVLCTSDVAERISRVHLHGAHSQKIETEVSAAIKGLDKKFVAQPIGFADAADRLMVRPDWVRRPTAGSSGIIVEVERGQTLINNKDIQAMWKTHLALRFDHLVLIVPVSNQRKRSGKPYREVVFDRVQHRIGQFFASADRNVRVDTVDVFGYGD